MSHSQWPDNCEANTWQVISNSLDIDFIHGDIYGRPRKKYHCILCKLLWKHWTHKMLVWCKVSKSLSQWYYMQNIMIITIFVFYFIIIIKKGMWIINHCLGFGHEIMVCVVCLAMFLAQRSTQFMGKTWMALVLWNRAFVSLFPFKYHAVTPFITSRIPQSHKQELGRYFYY